MRPRLIAVPGPLHDAAPCPCPARWAARSPSRRRHASAKTHGIARRHSKHGRCPAASAVASSRKNSSVYRFGVITARCRPLNSSTQQIHALVSSGGGRVCARRVWKAPPRLPIMVPRAGVAMMSPVGRDAVLERHRRICHVGRNAREARACRKRGVHREERGACRRWTRGRMTVDNQRRLNCLDSSIVVGDDQGIRELAENATCAPSC